MHLGVCYRTPPILVAVRPKDTGEACDWDATSESTLCMKDLLMVGETAAGEEVEVSEGGV